MTSLLTPPTGDLFNEALLGDADALDQLLRQHRPDIEAVCHRRLRSRSDAEDAIQETLLRGMRNLGAVEDPTRLKSYLCRIAERVCLDMLRAGAKAMPHVMDTPTTTDGPETITLEKERAQLVRETLQALGERQATALWMRDAMGESVPAVAAKLGVTEGSARVLLTRARARMRDGWSKAAAFLPGFGLKLPAFAVKVLQFGPLAIPALVPAIALVTAAVVAPFAIHEFAVQTAPVEQTPEASPKTADQASVPAMVRPEAADSVATPGIAHAPEQRPSTPATRPSDDRGITTSATMDEGPRGSIEAGDSRIGLGDTGDPRDDEVGAGDPDVLGVGVDMDELQEVLDGSPLPD